jgi:hypothetical protein
MHLPSPAAAARHPRASSSSRTDSFLQAARQLLRFCRLAHRFLQQPQSKGGVSSPNHFRHDHAAAAPVVISCNFSNSPASRLSSFPVLRAAHAFFFLKSVRQLHHHRQLLHVRLLLQLLPSSPDEKSSFPSSISPISCLLSREEMPTLLLLKENSRQFAANREETAITCLLSPTPALLHLPT